MMSVLDSIDSRVHYPVKNDVKDMGIGFVGAAGIVDMKHCPAYRKAGFKLVGITDINLEAAKNLAKTHQIPNIYPELASMLDNPEIQIIDCAIPNKGRKAIVEAVAAAGKHLLIQKPLADSSNEAQSFIDIARKAGIKFAVNQNARWAPTYAAATQLLESGIIGNPYWVHHQLLSGFDWFNQKDWHRHLNRFQMHQYGIHHFDILAVWLGRQPSRIFAQMTRRPDQQYKGDMMTSVSCYYHKELQANLQETNALHPSRPWATHFEIHGTRGCIVSENLDRISLYTPETGDEGEHHTFGISWFPDAFAYPMYELMRAILDDKEPAHSAAATLASLKTMEAAYASADTNLPINL